MAAAEDGVVLDTNEDVRARELLGKAVVDPISAQRVVMEAHGGAVDWGVVDWSNPLLKQLADLSSLSSHDLPQAAHMRRRVRRTLPEEHPIVQKELAGASPHTRGDVAYLPDREMSHPDGCDSARASSMAGVYGIASPGFEQRPPHNTQAVLPSPGLAEAEKAAEPSPAAVAAMAQLVHISPELLESDPRLGAIVRRVAEQRAPVDRVAAAMLSGSVAALPDVTDAARETAADRARREATKASVLSPNRAFRESDIVGYEHLVPVDERPKSMHDVDYETWQQRVLDVGAGDEDAENFDSYREQLTLAQGRLLAVSERTTHNAEQEKAARVPLIAQVPTPSPEDVVTNAIEDALVTSARGDRSSPLPEQE